MGKMLPDWHDRTVVCIASGPSVTLEDCELVRASGHPVIVTNTTFRLCPWAQVLFGYDVNWWRFYLEEVRAVFAGRLFCKSPRLRSAGVEWALENPRVKSFGNSGACSVSLATCAGASRIVLLGFDAQVGAQSHHHGDHPAGLRNCDSAPYWPAQFTRLARYVKWRGVEVLNASRETALTQFQRVWLEACL